MELMSMEAALAAMLAEGAIGPSEQVMLAQARGRVLGQSVQARRDQPPFAASVMDGWAIRAVDGLEPRQIVGQSQAGRGASVPVGPKQAVRIFTGAPMPEGADHVVMQEHARQEADQLLISGLGQVNVRPPGADFAAGAVLLEAGMRLDGARLSVLAAAGIAQVGVMVRPRIALLVTGGELVAPGRQPGPDQIFESVSFGLAAMVEAWGAQLVGQHACGDSLDDILAGLRQLQETGPDLIMVTGGASVGAFDFSRSAAQASGAQLVVDKVALRPGKPTWFARALHDGRKLALLGLPGNPASALVCARVFLRAIIEQQLGLSEGERARPVEAVLQAPLGPNGERTHLMRAILTHGAGARLQVEPIQDWDSGRVLPFARANALLIHPAHAPARQPGDIVEALWLD